MVNRPSGPNRVKSGFRRRSQRVPAQLPVVAQGTLTDETPFVDPTRAIVLSAHGCLITLSASISLGDRLILRNTANRGEQDCRVVYLGEKQAVGPKLAFASKPPPRSSGVSSTHLGTGASS